MMIMQDMRGTIITTVEDTNQIHQRDMSHTNSIKLPKRSIIMIPTMYVYHLTYSQRVHSWNYHVIIPILIPSQKIKWMNCYYVLCHICILV